MRRIPNSGCYLTFTLFQPSVFCAVVFTHLSVIVLNQTLYVIYFIGSFTFHMSLVFMSTPPSVCLFLYVLSFYLSLSLSLSSLHLGLHPRIFSHPNVLPMLGACQSPPAPHPIIITHWMPYGSLYNVLHEGTSEYFWSQSLHLSPVLVACT